MLLVSAECVELIRAMPDLISDPKEPNDVMRMVNIAEDITDALRYAMKSFLSPRKRGARRSAIRGTDAGHGAS